MITAGSAILGLSLLEACSSPAHSGPKADIPTADPFFGFGGGEQRTIGSIPMCWCPPGDFRMGSPANEPQRRADEAQVDVTLSRGFWMGRFSITQAQWTRVAGVLPGELSAGAGDVMPVYNVNFAESESFCDKLTAVARSPNDLPAGWTFRLPTEAQWEYACRAIADMIIASAPALSDRRQCRFRR